MSIADVCGILRLSASARAALVGHDDDDLPLTLGPGESHALAPAPAGVVRVPVRVPANPYTIRGGAMATVALKRYEDALYALVCGWIGIEYLARRCSAFGDTSAVIWTSAMS